MIKSKSEGYDPHQRPKDRQGGLSQAIGTSVVQTSRATRYETRPHHCDASDAGRRYDRFSRDRN
jgi:hypothetical protein